MHRPPRITRRRGYGAAPACAAVGLALLLGSCSHTPETADPSTDPYAGGQSYPWTDRLDAPGTDPYAGDRTYPWEGVRARPPGLGAADLNNENVLSDLSWTSASNAWGPVEKNQSNGDKLQNDGRPLTIGGQVYAKGLGVHANSEVSYALGGMCNVFTAQVGLDDEVGDRGSVIFQVWSGNTKLYDSGVVTGKDAPKAVSVDVTGVQNLQLVVTDAANGISYDHADWADAKVSCPSRQPSGDNFVSDLPWTAAQNTWGPVERDQSNGEKLQGDGKPLTIGGQVFAKGLGVHAAASLTYALGGRCTTFSAQVGLDDEVGDRGRVVFQVYGDGTLLYESPVRRGVDPALPISVAVGGVRELRLVTGNAGDGVSYDHADWADARLSCTSDTTPPGVPGGLSAAPVAGGVALDWADNAEPDLAGYLVYRGTAPGGPFTQLTGSPVPDSAYTDLTAPEGVPSYYQVVASDASGNLSLPASASATRAAGGSPSIAVQNLDGGPWSDRLVFSRIGSLTSPPSNAVHDRVSLQISNGGTGLLRVSALNLTGPWTLDPAVTLPLDVPAGGSTSVRLRFTAEGSAKSSAGTLTVSSNDAANPALKVQLAGLWQSQPENGQEPNVLQIRDAFGYGLSLLGGESSLDQLGLVRAQGDEVLSAYWQRADETQPVTVRQLAAYHTQGNTATLSWHDKKSATTTAILTQIGADAQTLLPRQGSASPAFQSFTPPVSTFGFKVDGEWGDPRRNSQTTDRNNGCARPCGQHLRFYQARDRAGAVMPGTNFLIMDYAGINYDYNDNVYVLTNLKPAPILLNVGGATFTDPAGNVWLSDKDQNGDAPYTPATAINEGSASTTYDIAGTDNDLLYRTYRGNVGASTPQASRQITFNVPVNNGTYAVRLHFADLAWNTPGQRVFDVSAEGVLRVDNLDIVASSGGGRTALVVPIDNVVVQDGKLTLDFRAETDFPSISGIEILR